MSELVNTMSAAAAFAAEQPSLLQATSSSQKIAHAHPIDYSSEKHKGGLRRLIAELEKDGNAYPFLEPVNWEGKSHETNLTIYSSRPR